MVVESFVILERGPVAADVLGYRRTN